MNKVALYEEMRLKKSGEVVRVYGIDPVEKIAVVFCPSQYQKVNNGWLYIKVSLLVPRGFPVSNKDCVSKTQKNKAKERMKLIDATWQTSDRNL